MDDIQKKLRDFDRQFHGGRQLHSELIEITPLMFPAVGLILGVVFGEYFSPSGSALFFIAAAAALTAVSAYLFIAPAKSRYIAAYAALIGFCCLVAARLEHPYRPQDNDIRGLVSDGRTLATIEGVVESEPFVLDRNRWKFGRFSRGDPSSGFYLRVTGVEALDGWRQVSGTTRVWVNEGVSDLRVGDTIRAYCRLDTISGPTNPGEFDRKTYMARQGIHTVVSIQGRSSITVIDSRPRQQGIVERLGQTLRRQANAYLLADTVIENDQQALLEALLLGQRANISRSTYQAFERTGLLHFISLSGLHLGIIAGLVWWAGKLAGLLKPARAVICVIAVIIFLLIVPPRAPTLRAAVIVFTFCAAALMKRKTNAMNILSLAAIILIMLFPTDIFTAGWQLSFTCVTGIILLAGTIERKLFGWKDSLTDTYLPVDGALTRIPRWLISYAVGMFSVGLAAGLGSLGITAYHFHTANLMTAFWTVLAFPFVALLLVLGYCKIIISMLWPTIGILLGYVINITAITLHRLIEFAAELAPGQIVTGALPLGVILGFYGLILFVRFVNFRRPFIKPACCFAASIAIASYAGFYPLPGVDDTLAIHCLDVGHGQAIVAELPGGKTLLFDAGSLYRSDIGRRIVFPFLRYSGTNRINAVTISHDDIDHFNGLPEIVQQVPTGGVYANTAFLERTQTQTAAGFLAEALAEHDLHIEPLEKLDKTSYSESGVEMTIIWPTAAACADPNLSDNDKSIVKLIEYAGASILLPGDIEHYAQTQVLEILDGRQVDILVLPHHGSTVTLTNDFVERLGADILITSGSRTSIETGRAYFPQDDQQLYHTAVNGAVSVTIDSSGAAEVAAFLK